MHLLNPLSQGSVPSPIHSPKSEIPEASGLLSQLHLSVLSETGYDVKPKIQTHCYVLP